MKLIAGVAASALAATTMTITTLTMPAAAAAADPRPVQIAGDWIAGQLTNGVAVGDFPDIGLSIDAGLAFEALGRSADAARVADGIGAAMVTTPTNPYGYVRSDEYGAEGKYANATAKAAAFVQRLGRNPVDAYPEVDLLAQLEELTADTTGLIADVSAYGNYENTIGQAFAAEALTVAGSPEAGAATDALLQQQCPAGFFRLALEATACDDATGIPDPDVTALATLSLVELESSDPAVTQAVDRATGWLAEVQRADGSLNGGVSTPEPNANTTGLAGWALGAAGKVADAEQAAAWTRALQAADVAGCATKAPTGAIAYDAADLTTGRAGGIDAARGKWRRTTFQAAPVLAWAPAATGPLGVSSPATAVEKTTVTVTVTGLAPGEQACLAFGDQTKALVGTGADLDVPVTLPAGASTHTFVVTTLAGSHSTVTAAIVAPATASPTPAPVSAQPVPAPSVGDLATKRLVKVRKNRFALKVACEGTTPCDGRVVVRSKGKVVAKPGQRARRIVVAKKSYAVAPGQTRKVVLRVRKPARRVLAGGKVKVRAVAAAPGARRTTETFWLKRAR